MTMTSDTALPTVTDEMLKEVLRASTPFTIVILKPGPHFKKPGPDRTEEIAQLIWAHGKRNYALHLAGLHPVICPIADGSDVVGVSIFRADEADVAGILDSDPAIGAGVLTYEMHPTRTFTIATSGAAT